ncbi:hypothetical protein JHD46_07920 [Sulfurimonas sp. SAG-AH-194-C20]|nr:hypothetical protein [Sulfurimonas sp. SAG-AH-194-C20]MDF1879560.1 hypothetical protein [Sulfurimonas sp. SAG-AH-194-C20]
MNLENYIGLIDQSDNTMKSTDLHKFVYEATGKYEDMRSFHKKLKTVLFDTETPTDAQISDGVRFAPSLDTRGYIKYFTLTEVECNMIMASADVRHLRFMAEVFVKAKEIFEGKQNTPSLPQTYLEAINNTSYKNRKVA